jgi:hypothetical protein
MLVLTDARLELIGVLVLLLIIVAGGYALLRRLSQVNAPEVIVRCREGHVFRTAWIPGVSFNAIRLGPVRWQYCPVGSHWTLVAPIGR